MALARCIGCGEPLSRTTEKYDLAVKPIGYPNTSTICGISTCENPALIWLKESEVEKYRSGVRVFSYQTATSKVLVGEI